MNASLRSIVFAVLVVVAGASGACGGRSGAAREPGAAVGAYAALRWVPADATLVIAGRRADDASRVLREVIDLLGIGFDVDAAEVQRRMRATIGFDILSPEGLAQAGIAAGGGFALFSQDVSPTLAVQLDDPTRTQVAIDRFRSGGVTVDTTTIDGVEVFSYRAERDGHLHWAIADGWLWVHLEIPGGPAPQGAWFSSLRAARGAMAAHPDWKAALAAGRRLGASVPADGPPVIGLARLPALARASAPHGGDAACLAITGAGGRVFLAAGVTGADGAIAIDVELGASAARLAAMLTPPLAGWAGAREGAPIQAEWALDLAPLGAAMAECDGGDLARSQRDIGLRALRLFVHTVDLGDLAGRGAVHLDLSSKRLIAGALDEIPGRSFLEKKRTIGPWKGAEIAVPMFPAFTYALTDDVFVAGVGLDLATAVGAGRMASTPSVAHLRLVPGGLSTETWHALVEAAGVPESQRAELVSRIQRWAHAEVDVVIRGGALSITGRSRRRQ